MTVTLRPEKALLVEGLFLSMLDEHRPGVRFHSCRFSYDCSQFADREGGNMLYVWRLHMRGPDHKGELTSTASFEEGTEPSIIASYFAQACIPQGVIITSRLRDLPVFRSKHSRRLFP